MKFIDLQSEYENITVNFGSNRFYIDLNDKNDYPEAIEIISNALVNLLGNEYIEYSHSCDYSRITFNIYGKDGKTHNLTYKMPVFSNIEA